jgi:hypothetical protein
MVELKKIYADFEKGMYLAEAQVSIVNGYNLAGLFPKIEMDTKKVTIVDSTPIDKFIDQTGKKKKVAKGASARKIRGEVVTPDGFKLEHNEIEYVIENEDMLHPTFNLIQEIQAMGYVLATDIDQVVYNTVKDHGQLITDNKIVGGWGETATELKTMIRDISRLKKSMRPKPYSVDLFAYGDEADTELKARAAQSVEDYQLPQNGFNVEDTLNLMNARNFWGGLNMDDGEVFGFDSKNPGLDLIFKKYSNPNIKSIPTIQGMEALLPPINMLMFDNSKEETEPQTTIKVATTCGAYPRAKGERMIQYADIISK